MNTARRVLKNASFLTFSGLAAQFLSFLTIIYLAHVLGPEKFGRLNFALTLTAHFMLFSNPGLTRLGTKEIVRQPEPLSEYTGNILTMRLCFALASFLLLTAIALLLEKPAEVKNLIILYAVGFIPGAILLDRIFQGVFWICEQYVDINSIADLITAGNY